MTIQSPTVVTRRRSFDWVLLVVGTVCMLGGPWVLVYSGVENLVVIYFAVLATLAVAPVCIALWARRVDERSR